MKELYNFDKNRKLFLAIDSNAIVHRAYHAYPPTLRTTTGVQVNAVFGFTSMLLEALRKFHPEYVLATFDTGKPTFRHAEYADYKAGRKPVDDEMIKQFPLVYEVLDALNIPILKKEGFEADDLLGSIAENIARGGWNNQNLELLILSGDKDLFQLVEDRIEVCLPQGSFRNLKVYDKKAVFEKMGVNPDQITDYKGIVGDPSDNIPGIKGIGEKTAVELLQKLYTLGGIYDKLESVKPRYAKLFSESIEQAEFSKKLAEIKRDIKLGIKLEDCLTADFDKQEVLSVFAKFEFRSLMGKIPDNIEDKRASAIKLSKDAVSGKDALVYGGGANFGKSTNSDIGEGRNMSKNKKYVWQNSLFSDVGTPSSSLEEGIKIVENGETFKHFLDINKDKGLKIVAVYFGDEKSFKSLRRSVVFKDGEKNIYINEFCGDEYISNRVDGKNSALAIKISIEEGQNKDMHNFVKVIHNAEDIGRTIKVVGSCSCETTFYNWEQFVSQEKVFNMLEGNNNIDLQGSELFYRKNAFKQFSNIFDIKIFGHFLSAGEKSYDLNYLALKWLKIFLPDEYQYDDINYVFDLVEKIAVAQKDFLKDFEDIKFVAGLENNLSILLGKIENTGLRIDFQYLLKIEKEIDEQISGVKKKIFYFVGHEFNPDSPKQVSQIIYDELGIAPKKKGKKQDSTRESVLNELVHLHPFIPELLKYRLLSKMKSTYITGFINLFENYHVIKEKEDGGCVTEKITRELMEDEKFTDLIKENKFYIFTNFLQTGTSSGRLSSQNPNLQNIPINGEWAGKFRNIFIPRNGYKLVSVDYSQIEYRVMADFSGDDNLRKYFESGADIHKATASEIFSVEESEVTDDQRKVGKTVNFGILYGQTAFGLAKQLDISPVNAKTYIDKYFEKYPKIAEYIEKQKNNASQKGYVETIIGRRRYIGGLNTRNRFIREASEREAINTPIQGSASDLMKVAMLLADNSAIRAQGQLSSQRKNDENKYNASNCLNDVRILLQVHDELIFEVKEDLVKDFEKEAVEAFKKAGELLGVKIPLSVHFSYGDNMAELK